MFLGFGVSGPFQPRPHFRRERYFWHFVWLWFEVVGSRRQFIEVVALTEATITKRFVP